MHNKIVKTLDNRQKDFTIPSQSFAEENSRSFLSITFPLTTKSTFSIHARLALNKDVPHDAGLAGKREESIFRRASAPKPHSCRVVLGIHDQGGGLS
jgi:hypothetical protein